MLRIIRKHTRLISITFSLVLLINVFAPGVSYAITGSSSMPEYRSFEPVNTTNMVNPLNGDFTYNIPLLNIPNGYPLNLSYHSNEINPEAQASWVGLGWTLNPGAINRTKRGFPDEFNGEEVHFHTKMPNDWTLTMGVGAGAEAFGFQGSLLTSLRYNNYKGFGRTVSGSIGYEGLINLGFSYEAGRIKFSPTINAMSLAKTAISAAKGKGKSTNTNEVPKTETETKTDENEQKSETNNDAQTKEETTAKTETKSYGGRFLSGAKSYMQNIVVGALIHDWSPNQPVSIQTKVPEYNGYIFNLKFEAGMNLPPVSIDISSINTGAFVIHKYKDDINRYAFGYFNMENRGESDLGDSYNEIENVFEKKDRYLAIPFANYDMFNVTGEALGGSFRGFRADFGHFRPETSLSTTVNGKIGIDIALPSIFSIVPPGVIDLETTVGMDIGGGYGEINTGDWLNSLKGNTESLNFKYASDFKYNTNEKIIFRFASDKVGSISRNVTDNAVRANLNKSFTTSTLEFDEQEIPATLNNQRVPRGSYVSMRSDEDFKKKSTNVRYDVYQKSLYVQTTSGTWIDYNSNTTLDPSTPTERTGSGIGEIVSYNGDGVRHVYGLPLKTKAEKEIRVSLQAGQYTLQQSEGLIAIVNQSSAWDVENGSKFKTGFESNSSYASQFLLTQMTSPDYIDRTMNGLTPDDFGSYTRFNYAKATTATNWYKFRTPFKNASFSYGSLSERNDDMASYSGGEKELYYIQSISSKTHVAIFRTSDRKDAIGASNVEILGGMDGSSVKQKRLDRIDLYALQDCEDLGNNGIYTPKAGVQPIQSVRFQFDYSLCKNLDNTELVSGVREGKLTLKKVWFEYEGKVKSKVSPYTFQYSYPDPSTSPYPTKYSTLQMAIASNAAAQNPDYNVLDSDGWGNYRNFGKIRGFLGDLAQFYPFSYQGSLSTGTPADPAAWCLKVVKLPSGGEIHVQYEQHDYRYVQDKTAMVMVPLSTATSQNENDFKDKPYYIDLAKAGLDVSGHDLMQIAHQLFKPMTLAQNNNRMYFNFLFSLIGDVNPDYKKLYTDYLDGYARIAGYGVKDSKIFFYFWDKPASYDQIQEIDLGGGHTKWEMPRKACQEFYQSSRQGRISDEPNAMGEGDLNAGSLVNLFSKARQIAGAVQMCYRMQPEMSYVRLQLPDHLSKKGGGVRVKRLLMYDKGIASDDDKVLYGQEYEYKKDGVSSGVTPNEPGTLRKENVLVNPLDRDSQSKLEAMLYGEDMYDNEGPLGHSLYPAASVSYSYVKICNIHKGNTTNGYEVHEFYTCKDYPFIAKYTGVLKQHEVPKGGGIVTLPYERVTPHLTQGYAFIMNDMHGKFKRLAKYPTGSTSPVYEERYEYTKIGEPVKVIDENKRVSWQVLGKESEMFAERREVNDFSNSTSFGVDMTAGAWTIQSGPVPIPVPIIYPTRVMGYGHVSEQILRTHVTTKVISYSVMPKKTITKAEGVFHTTENLVYDKYTGNPVITRETDDFDKSYINQTFMASWDYPNMQSKYMNERLVVKSKIVFLSGSYYLQFDATNGGCAALDNFVLGDFLGIRQDAGPDSDVPPALYHVAEIDRPNIRIRLSKSALDQMGLTALVDQPVDVNILQSGRTNMINQKSGSLVAYNRPGIYDYSTPPVSSTITSFVSLLNSAYAGADNVTIPASQIPAGLKMIDPLSGECVKGRDFSMEINFSKLNGKTYVKVGNKGNGSRKSLPANYSTVASATLVNGAYQMTTATQPEGVPETNMQRAAIWNQTKIDLSQCFDLRYRVNFGTRNNLGGDGMAFVLQNLSLAAIGTTGSNLGIGRVPGGTHFGSLTAGEVVYEPIVLGVEFDTYFNGEAGIIANDVYYLNIPQQNISEAPLEEQKDLKEKNIIHPPSVTCTDANCSDIDYDHISIFKGGPLPFSLPNAYPEGSLPVAAVPDNTKPYGARNIEDGAFHDVRITWDPTLLQFRVYFDGLLRKQVAGDIRSLANGQQFVYYGWTAGQSFTNNQIVQPIGAYSGCGGSTAPGCASVVNGTAGTFSYDAISGYIQFTPTDGCAQNVECLSLCEAAEPLILGGIITANAQTFSHEWDYDATKYPILTNAGAETTLFSNMNEYETGSRGKWRIKDTYTYRTAIKEGLNYASGEMRDFTLFNWKNPEVNDYTKWLLSNTTTQYTPNGAVYEDKNILDVYSTAIYGYNNTLPIAVAQNARANSILFESFENYYKGNSSKYYLESGYEVPVAFVDPENTATVRTSAKAHTGKYSFKLAKDIDYSLGKVTTAANSKVTARVWITSDQNIEKLKGNVKMSLHGTNNIVMTYVSSAGPWMQFEASVTPGTLSSTDLKIKVVDLPGVDFGNIYVDDLRTQHDNSEMVCYVYDKAQRLVAVFDDRHYAMIYQYNAEGLLVRKLKETVEGIKTISETQYNSPGEVIP